MRVKSGRLGEETQLKVIVFSERVGSDLEANSFGEKSDYYTLRKNDWNRDSHLKPITTHLYSRNCRKGSLGPGHIEYQ